MDDDETRSVPARHWVASGLLFVAHHTPPQCDVPMSKEAVDEGATPFNPLECIVSIGPAKVIQVCG